MKLSHLFFWLILTSGLVGVGIVGWRLVDQLIVSVSVDGLLTDQENLEVQSVVQSMLPQSLLRLDADELGVRLKALSWPERVQIRRVWPESLSISISKPSVVARWRDGGVLTSRGEVVFMNDPTHGNLPELSAEIASPEFSMNRFEVLNSLLGTSSLRLTGLHQDQLGEWQVVLNRQIIIKLGSNDTHERFRRALLVYQRAMENESSGDTLNFPALDARYQNGVAVSWPSASDQLVAYGQ